MPERKPKIIKKDPKREPPKKANPLYDAFTYQISAVTVIARQIEADSTFAVPSLVSRFLDEFGRKTA